MYLMGWKFLDLSIIDISFCDKKKTKNLPAVFFFNFKIPELSNLFSPVIKHLIP